MRGPWWMWMIWGAGLYALLTGCSSMLPDRMVDGVAVYIRDAKTVDDYCRPRLPVEQRSGPHVFGCYVARDRTVMAERGYPAVLAHELRHAQGWDHVGPCHSTVENPNGVKLDGSPCEWFRR